MLIFLIHIYCLLINKQILKNYPNCVKQNHCNLVSAYYSLSLSIYEMLKVDEISIFPSPAQSNQ
jgi:hypothetical protein